jgi:prepilin-type N-terminal cleavage/methylation domain-containing protein
LKIKNKGFTLIELMIVIAIIAIIAAIAIPNLIEARKSGNESSAIGSLKAVTTAQAMFQQQDKDGVSGQNYASNLAVLGATSSRLHGCRFQGTGSSVGLSPSREGRRSRHAPSRDGAWVFPTSRNRGLARGRAPKPNQPGVPSPCPVTRRASR